MSRRTVTLLQVLVVLLLPIGWLVGVVAEHGIEPGWVIGTVLSWLLAFAAFLSTAWVVQSRTPRRRATAGSSALPRTP